MSVQKRESASASGKEEVTCSMLMGSTLASTDFVGVRWCTQVNLMQWMHINTHSLHSSSTSRNMFNLLFCIKNSTKSSTRSSLSILQYFVISDIGQADNAKWNSCTKFNTNHRGSHHATLRGLGSIKECAMACADRGNCITFRIMLENVRLQIPWD